MITGYIDEDFVPLIRLFVHGTQGQFHEIEAVFDTGYNSYLTIPPALIEALGLPYKGEQEVMLADGKIHTALTYYGTVKTDKTLVNVEIEAAEGIPIAGMRLFDGYRAAMDIETNGSLSLEEK